MRDLTLEECVVVAGGSRFEQDSDTNEISEIVVVSSNNDWAWWPQTATPEINDGEWIYYGGSDLVEEITVTAHALTIWDRFKDFLGLDGSDFGATSSADLGYVSVAGSGVAVLIPLNENGDIKGRVGVEIDLSLMDDPKVNVGPISGLGYESEADDGFEITPTSVTYTFNITQWWQGLDQGFGLYQNSGGHYYFGYPPGASPGDGL